MTTPSLAKKHGLTYAEQEKVLMCAKQLSNCKIYKGTSTTRLYFACEPNYQVYLDVISGKWFSTIPSAKADEQIKYHRSRLAAEYKSF
jgi:hypothetical protein